MKDKRKDLFAVILTGLCSAFFLLFKFIKISPIIGSKVSYFAFSDIVMPLSGTFGFGFIGFFVALRMLARVFLFGLPILKPIFYLPGVCASFYWAFESKKISLILPLLCMIAFLAHPVGSMAPLYCLYWFIPMALFFVKEKTIFMHSLASTFIAHSVGSVIWLYVNPMNPAVWLGLIPLVAFERFVFAGGMTVAYYAIAFLKEWMFSFTLRAKRIFHD